MSVQEDPLAHVYVPGLPVVLLDKSYGLLDLPDIVLELIMEDLGVWEAAGLSITCHKLHDLFVNVDPPKTLLDTLLFQPKFSILLGSSAPMVHIFQFLWHDTADDVIKRMLLGKPPTNSANIAKGLTKLFQAWTKTKEAQNWRQERSAHFKLLLWAASGGKFRSAEEYNIPALSGNEPE